MNNRDNRKTHSGLSALGAAIVLVMGLALAGSSAADDAKTIATTNCNSCHGEGGNSVIPMFPNVAGLQEEYIAKQLWNYKSGQRKSDIMSPVVEKLMPEDIPLLAAYYSGQKMNRGSSVDKQAIERGKQIYFNGNDDSGLPPCVGCHEPEGSGHHGYPRLGGQQAQYVVQELKNFAAGGRTNDVSRYMRVIAKRMSEAEMRSVAEYLAGLDAK